jgi:hypothetical protein
MKLQGLQFRYDGREEQRPKQTLPTNPIPARPNNLINISTTLEVNQMDTTEHQDYPSDDDDLEAQRSTIRQSLTEIGDDISFAMCSGNLTFPLAIGVPSFGPLLTMMTPNDPTDEEWSKVSAIVCEVVATKLDASALPLTALLDGKFENRRRRDRTQHSRLRLAFIARRGVSLA